MKSDSIDSLTNTLPIGPFQEGLWLFWQLNPGSPAYSMPEVFHFDGEFDLEAATLAFNETIRRHEALRTTFRDTDTGVVQVIDGNPAPASVDVVDLRGLAESERSAGVQAALDAAANLPFDLIAGPVIRLTAIRVSNSRTSLVMVVHHIVCDGASMAIIFEEFGELYRSARQGTAPDLGPVAPGYSTFVKRQLAGIADGAFKEESTYWRERLAGLTASALPGVDRVASRLPEALETFTLSTTFDDELTAAVWAYARRAKATPFAILLCAFKVMTAVATGDNEVAIGTATSGRSPEVARTVGMLTNVVVSRSRIDVSRSFAAVLEEVSLDLMDAIDHQDLPFSRVAAELREAGLQPGANIVRTGFSAGAIGELRLGHGRLSEVVARSAEGAFELAVVAEITPVGIAIDWEYALSTYSREVGEGYCAAYQDILGALLHRPDEAINSLGLNGILARVVGLPGDAPSTGTESPADGDEPAGDVLTPVEKAVAAVWSEVIGVPVQSPHDDFFDLGGHSTLASRVIVLVRSRITPTVTLRLLFDHSELRDFASRLDVATE